MTCAPLNARISRRCGRGILAMKEHTELIQEELEAIQACIEELESLLKRAHSHLAKQQEEWELGRQEQWRLKKELAALKRLNEEYDAIEAENQMLKTRQEALRETLKSVLAATKALSAEFRA